LAKSSFLYINGSKMSFFVVDDDHVAGDEGEEVPGRRLVRAFFECFPYVCPELVLVKRRLLYRNGSNRPSLIGCRDRLGTRLKREKRSKNARTTARFFWFRRDIFQAFNRYARVESGGYSGTFLWFLSRACFGKSSSCCA
jgi:hypothetical protein